MFGRDLVKGILPRQSEAENLPRKLCTLYAIAILISTADDRAKHPFHVSLADVLEARRGSASHIHIFNKLGTVASKDTLYSFIHQSAPLCLEMGPLARLPPEVQNIVLIVSIDNVDKTSPTRRRLQERRRWISMGRQ
jgi:hypothetical protein